MDVRGAQSYSHLPTPTLMRPTRGRATSRLTQTYSELLAARGVLTCGLTRQACASPPVPSERRAPVVGETLEVEVTPLLLLLLLLLLSSGPSLRSVGMHLLVRGFGRRC